MAAFRQEWSAEQDVWFSPPSTQTYCVRHAQRSHRNELRLWLSYVQREGHSLKTEAKVSCKSNGIIQGFTIVDGVWRVGNVNVWLASNVNFTL